MGFVKTKKLKYKNNKALDDCKDFLNSFFSLKILRPKRKSCQKKISKFSDFLHHYHPPPLLLHFVDPSSGLNDDFLQIWQFRAIFDWKYRIGVTVWVCFKVRLWFLLIREKRKKLKFLGKGDKKAVKHRRWRAISCQALGGSKSFIKNPSLCVFYNFDKIKEKFFFILDRKWRLWEYLTETREKRGKKV